MVAGAIAGVGALGLGVGTGWSIVIGVPVFLATVGCFAVWAELAIRGYRSEIVVRFPTPATDEHSRAFRRQSALAHDWLPGVT